MILFSHDKEIIFKITNAVLLVWLVAALVIASSSIIRLVLKEPVRTYSYDEYKLDSCSYMKEGLDITDPEIEQRCQLNYNNYKFAQENTDYNKWLTLYTSLANVLIVGGVMYFINHKKEHKAS